ncbi:hypothetical protein FZW96_01400 [Bacillus sp. BGMRC 2118]|nr:hypothetical protein FZW96_01400 [Bacillus sp. BGMRC 2118]
MGIIRNQKMMPKLFTSSIKNPDSNQKLYRTSQLSKFIIDQQNVNQQITESFKGVQQEMKVNKSEQEQYFHEVISQIQKQEHMQSHFDNRLVQHELINRTLLDRIQHLEKINEEIKLKLESDTAIHQAILDGITAQDHFGQRVSQKIGENEDMLDSINAQLTKQEELYENLSQTLELQEAFHQTIMDKLDQQEALTQKISRQLDHLKSIIFERFSYVTEKIEHSWKTTSNYISGFFSKTEDNHDLEEEIVDNRKQ